jgi:hypothetical protein
MSSAAPAEVLAEIAPRRVLVAAGSGKMPRRLASVRLVEKAFSREPRPLTDWIEESVP